MKRTNRPHHAVTFLEQVVTGLLIGLTAIPPSALCGQAAVPIQPAPATFQFTRAESAPAPAEAVRQEGEPARRPASLATDRDPLAGPPALVAGAASGVTVSQNFHIVIGQTVQDGVPEAGTGRIESAGSEDIYSFTNAPGQTVYFDSFGTSSAIYWQVVDASGSEFFNWRFNWGDPGPFALPAAGLNRIRVYGVSGEAGTYGFKLWDVPPPQSFPIAIGQEVRDGLPVAGAGRVETPGAVDLYTFTNAAGQTVFFDSSGTSSAIYWQVVDTSGHELFNWHFNWGDPGRFALPVAGTNRIRAYGVSGEAGTYGFKLWDTPRPESFEIAVGQQVTTGVPSAGAGRIESPGAEDIYTFANSPGQTIYFDSFGRTGGTIFWQIFDSSGEQLFNRDFAAGDAGKFTFLNAGANRIRVSGLADAVGTYGFVLVNTNSVGSITNQPPPTDRFVIAVGDTVTNGAPGAGAGNIEMPGARDIYTFQAGRGIYYFEDLGAAAPLDWALYDEIGTLVFNDRLDGNDPGRITLSGYAHHSPDRCIL